MSLELLKPFDLEAAKCGEEVLYVYTMGNTEDAKFVAEAGIDGDHACRDTEGNIFLANEEDLRMKPLAWCEDRPVYKGDVLYSKYGEGSWTIDSADDLASNNVVRFKEGGYAYLKDCMLTKPEPKKTTRTVKFLGYRSGCGELVLIDESEDEWAGCKRVPGADVTYEVEE